MLYGRFVRNFFRARPLRRSIVFCLLIFGLVSFWPLSRTLFPAPRVPVGALTKQVAQNGRGIGGMWYIPPSWLEQLSARGLQSVFTAESSVLDAVQCALSYSLYHQAFINNSHIPLITHQTWRSLSAETWSDIVRQGVDEWISIAAGDGKFLGPETAWFLWDDDGIDALIKKYEPELFESFQRLPYPVEKSDVFRIVVLKWFGGSYADVDTRPLKHPYTWVFESDLSPWTNITYVFDPPAAEAFAFLGYAPASYTALYSSDVVSYLSQPSVKAIFGIEADNLPEPDSTYWRRGYKYPIQITNWALCMAPHHPVADKFIQAFIQIVAENRDDLLAVDPLDITGPPALTAVVKDFAKQKDSELSWDALSGRNGDPKGGRGKVVAGDTLILPITGFNPGRGWIHNMGSQSVTDRNARLKHAAAGSWRKMDLKVHYGKLCRVLFGLCRDWKKIPDVHSKKRPIVGAGAPSV